MFKLNNIKKGIASVLALLTTATCLSAGSVAFAEDLVAINETIFPDKNFRTVISEVYDKDSNGYLSTAEIERVKVMKTKQSHLFRALKNFIILKNFIVLRSALKNLM